MATPPPVGVGPLHYQGYPPPNIDTTLYPTADAYIEACRNKQGGVEALVSSSDVEKIRYDANNKTLYVTFRKKGPRVTSTPTAVYYPVQESIVELFYNASSKGQFVWVVLRGPLKHLHTGYA